MAFFTYVAAAVGGSLLSGMMSGGGSSSDGSAGAAASAAATTDVANIQAKTASDYLDFQKQQYADMKPIAVAASAAQTATANQQAATATANDARAADYAAYDKSTFRPLEQGIVNDANSFDTTAKQNDLARQGVADVATAYDTQRKNALDTMSSYGINPNSNRFAAINSQLSQGQAAAGAGAATNARSQAEQMGYARKLDAASLGRNLAANASTAYGVSINAGNSSSANNTAAYNTAAAPGATLAAGMNTSSSMLGNAANSYYGAGNLYSQQYKTSSANSSAAMSGLGSIAGQWAGSTAGSAAIAAMADGGDVHKGAGRVRGIGGPVDDKVPAMLSNGEYVIPADTAKAIGISRLDKLVKQTHTPAATQRRRALTQGA